MIVQAFLWFCHGSNPVVGVLYKFVNVILHLYLFDIYLNIKNIPKHFLRWIMVLSQVELPQNYILLNFCVHFI